MSELPSIYLLPWYSYTRELSRDEIEDVLGVELKKNIDFSIEISAGEIEFSMKEKIKYIFKRNVCQGVRLSRWNYSCKIPREPGPVPSKYYDVISECAQYKNILLDIMNRVVTEATIQYNYY